MAFNPKGIEQVQELQIGKAGLPALICEDLISALVRARRIKALNRNSPPVYYPAS